MKKKNKLFPLRKQNLKKKKTVLELTYEKIEPKQGAPSKFADSI